MTHAYNMINDQYKQFNCQIRFLRDFRRSGGLRCWYNHHPQGPARDQEGTTVTGVDSSSGSRLRTQYLFVAEGVLLTVQPLWKNKNNNKCIVFYGLFRIKRRESSTFQERENVAWRLSGCCRFLVFGDWFCGAKGNSNKHVTLVHSPQLITTWDLLKEKPRWCVWTRGRESNANAVRYRNKWQNFLETTLHAKPR